MKSFTISENDSGQRLDKFLSKALPNLPQALLYKSIRTKNIKINRKRAEISTRLQTGDQVDVYLKDEFFVQPEKRYDFLSASRQLTILYEDDQLLLLDKKAGLLSHPNEGEYGDTLISRVKRYLYESGSYRPEAEQSFAPALVNRIDRNTGGIVIAAKSAEALRILNQKMKNRELHKHYLCIVHGCPKQKEAILEDYLVKDEAKNKVTVSHTAREGARMIRTQYRVLETRGNLSLLEIELLTGRTHQIRAHLASIGHPLLGDGKYGTNALNKPYGYKKQFLYSFRLHFDFTTESGRLAYLDGKCFTVDDVWFVSEFQQDRL